MGTDRERGTMIGYVNSNLTPGSHGTYALAKLIEGAKTAYLERWAQDIRTKNPNPEVASRAVASHMLDAGFSEDSLHRYLYYYAQHDENVYSFADLVEKLEELRRRPPITYTALVPTVTQPDPPQDHPHWFTASKAVEWLESWGFDIDPGLRLTGGLVFDLEARDVQAVLSSVAAEVSHLRARFRVGARKKLRFFNKVYVIGETKSLSYEQRPRRIDVHALESTSAVFDLNLPHELRSVLELLAPLDRGTPAAAVAGSWAAIEALFVGPGDTANRVIAASRMANVVACSYIRAELTSVANAYAEQCSDSLAAEIRDSADNLARTRVLEQAMRSDRSLRIPAVRDNLALERMYALVERPHEVIKGVVGQCEDAFRRLYRQRNLIVHAGDLTSIALSGTLRTVPPIVGAGIDRVFHNATSAGLSPLELSAKADVSIAGVMDNKRGLAQLLD
ncbi:hypothetical protein Rhe02_39080 [Rhizocola hellebori]|uniref:Uncharacterized protein n=2 Tax=Rhizocola hellebori TaxID=1392758 RepID=A0A8J3Q9Z3_9ACTN|nr:hypothetical protein Rhe02_39080 [Rhizocola hellebori]